MIKDVRLPFIAQLVVPSPCAKADGDDVITFCEVLAIQISQTGELCQCSHNVYNLFSSRNVPELLNIPGGIYVYVYIYNIS